MDVYSSVCTDSFRLASLKSIVCRLTNNLTVFGPLSKHFELSQMKKRKGNLLPSGASIAIE